VQSKHTKNRTTLQVTDTNYLAYLFMSCIMKNVFILWIGENYKTFFVLVFQQNKLVCLSKNIMHLHPTLGLGAICAYK
jgi:hypothetical protein